MATELTHAPTGTPTTDRKAIEDLLARVPDARVGSALRHQRELAGIPLDGAAAAAGIRSGELQAVETGRRAPDAELVARLLAQYGSTVDRWLPPRRPADLEAFVGLSDAEALRRYVRQVESWRGDGRPQGFRDEDLRVLVRILGTDPATIERRLRELTGCQPGTATRFRRVFLAAVAATTGLLLVAGVASASTAAPPAPATPAVAATATAIPEPASVIVSCPAPVADPAPAPATVAVPASASGATRVTFTIPPTVHVRVDAAGLPVAVSTNTGVAPACTDVWVVVGPEHPDGAPLVDLGLIDQAMTIAASEPMLPAPGDWRPAEWYPLA